METKELSGMTIPLPKAPPTQESYDRIQAHADDMDLKYCQMRNEKDTLAVKLAEVEKELSDTRQLYYGVVEQRNIFYGSLKIAIETLEKIKEEGTSKQWMMEFNRYVPRYSKFSIMAGEALLKLQPEKEIGEDDNG